MVKVGHTYLASFGHTPALYLDICIKSWETHVVIPFNQLALFYDILTRLAVDTNVHLNKPDPK